MAKTQVPDLGPNVHIFSPDTAVERVQLTVDRIHTERADDGMASNRHALLFMPGICGTDDAPLQIGAG